MGAGVPGGFPQRMRAGEFGKIPRGMRESVMIHSLAHFECTEIPLPYFGGTPSGHPQMLHRGPLLGASLQYQIMSSRGRESSFAALPLLSFVVKEIGVPRRKCRKYKKGRTKRSTLPTSSPPGAARRLNSERFPSFFPRQSCLRFLFC